MSMKSAGTVVIGGRARFCARPVHLPIAGLEGAERKQQCSETFADTVAFPLHHGTEQPREGVGRHELQTGSRQHEYAGIAQPDWQQAVLQRNKIAFGGPEHAKRVLAVRPECAERLIAVRT
jgi:hypothetical protein